MFIKKPTNSEPDAESNICNSIYSTVHWNMPQVY